MPAPVLAQRALVAALSARMFLSTEPVYADVAWIGAWICLASLARGRTLAAEAIGALGGTPTRLAVWRFAWRRWYLRIAHEAMAYQADRLVPAWIDRNVSVVGSLPPGGCVLVSVHHFNQRLGFAKLSSMVTELGAVSEFHLPEARDAVRQPVGRVSTSESFERARGRFAHRVFAQQFQPGPQIREALELLERGGSLVVLADHSVHKRARVFGTPFGVADGALWFAARSHKPIVPFFVTAPRRSGGRWELWCGDPMPFTQEALIETIQECIKRDPPSWAYWPEWCAARRARPGRSPAVLR